jgi:hypothetical protein
MGRAVRGGWVAAVVALALAACGSGAVTNGGGTPEEGTCATPGWMPGP